jgi:hypothetical protein
MLNTMNIFVLIPFTLPFHFKLQFKLFSDLNTDDWLSKIIKNKFNITENENMKLLPNPEFSFQLIYSSKMLF